MQTVKFIFDLDGTLTKQETLPLIAKYFNIEDTIEQITKNTIQGLIPFKESFIKRVELLKHLPINKISRIIEHIELYTSLKQFIKNNAENCIIATSNLDCWTSALLNSFKCKYYTSESTIKDNKVLGVKKILEKEKIVLENQNKGHKVVFIGDGYNDLQAMKVADIAIAVGYTNYPPESILATSNHYYQNESLLLNKLNTILMQFV